MVNGVIATAAYTGTWASIGTNGDISVQEHVLGMKEFKIKISQNTTGTTANVTITTAAFKLEVNCPTYTLSTISNHTQNAPVTIPSGSSATSLSVKINGSAYHSFAFPTAAACAPTF